MKKISMLLIFILSALFVSISVAATDEVIFFTLTNWTDHNPLSVLAGQYCVGNLIVGAHSSASADLQTLQIFCGNNTSHCPVKIFADRKCGTADGGPVIASFTMDVTRDVKIDLYSVTKAAGYSVIVNDQARTVVIGYDRR